MLVSLGRDRLNFTLPVLQGGLLWLALRMGHGPGVGISLGLALVISLLGWQRALGHGRQIIDTPTSRIASAAQGYTELRGHGGPLSGPPVLSPVNGLPVLWYRVVTHRRNAQNKWEHESTYESDTSFLLDDGTGTVAVDPEGAEMLVRRKDTHTEGDRRITQWCLIRDDPIYALGDFATLGSVSPDQDVSAQVRDLLAEWKRDHPTLLARFDQNQDGQISIEEWEHARAEARREVMALQQEVLSAPEAHVLRKPRDGRLYLISDLDPDQIARRYRWWAWFHITFFLTGAGALAWLGRHGLMS